MECISLVQNVALNFAQLILISQCILYIGPVLCVYFSYTSVYSVLAPIVDVVSAIKSTAGNTRPKEIYLIFFFLSYI